MKLSKRSKGDFFNVLKLFYLLLILLILLATATYTWFSLSRTPKINDMALYITTDAGGVLISHDMNASSEEWGRSLIYNEFFDENTVLRPVTYSDVDDTFYAAVVGSDGRIVSVTQPLSDEKHANRSDINGYYVKFTAYLRSANASQVHLSGDAIDPSSGSYVVGMPLWDDQAIIHNDGGHYLQSAMRVGFAITIYDKDGSVAKAHDEKVIYEPNCDVHLDYSRGYVATPNIHGEENLVPSERLIRQTSTAWWEANPVQKDVLVYEYGDFIDDTYLFDLEAGQTAQVDIYLWLEGQDVDCNYLTDEAAKIMANIQFHSTDGIQSGLEPIPGNE